MGTYRRKDLFLWLSAHWLSDLTWERTTNKEMMSFWHVWKHTRLHIIVDSGYYLIGTFGFSWPTGYSSPDTVTQWRTTDLNHQEWHPGPDTTQFTRQATQTIGPNSNVAIAHTDLQSQRVPSKLFLNMTLFQSPAPGLDATLVSRPPKRPFLSAIPQSWISQISVICLFRAGKGWSSGAGWTTFTRRRPRMDSGIGSSTDPNPLSLENMEWALTRWWWVLEWARGHKPSVHVHSHWVLTG